MKTLDGMEAIANACAQADAMMEDDKGMKKAFAKLFQFEPSKFSKFTTIGKNEVMWTQRTRRPRAAVAPSAWRGGAGSGRWLPA